MALRSLASQYGPASLAVIAHLLAADSSAKDTTARANALLDFDAGPIRFEHDGKQGGAIRLTAADGRILSERRGFQNAATLGGAARAWLRAPHVPDSGLP